MSAVAKGTATALLLILALGSWRGARPELEPTPPATTVSMDAIERQMSLIEGRTSDASDQVQHLLHSCEALALRVESLALEANDRLARAESPGFDTMLLCDSEKHRLGLPLVQEPSPDASDRAAQVRSQTLPGHHTVLDRCVEYSVTFHRSPAGGEPRVLIITFGAANSTNTEQGFGSGVALENNYDHVYVGQEARSNYQGLSVGKFFQLAGPLASLYSKVVTYGSSLGAYAALYYGGCLDATIIASAPRNPLHPIINRKRYLGNPYLHAQLSQVPSSRIPPIILLDPTVDVDVAFLERVVRPAYPSIRLVTVPFAGHAVLRALREGGLVKDFFLTAVEEDRIIDLAWGGPGSSIWEAEKGRYLLQRGDLVSAEQHLRRSLEISFDRPAARSLASLYLTAGRMEDLRRHLEEVGERLGSIQWMPDPVLKAHSPN